MPWSSQGGGPWGSGKGPWGSGPQSSGPTPPDLEELLRRSQDKLRTVLPGGSFGGRGFALIALAVLALWGFSGFFRVEPDELGVVLRFGKYVRDVQPGLNYHLPYPIESALTPKALRVNKIDVGSSGVPGATLCAGPRRLVVDVHPRPRFRCGKRVGLHVLCTPPGPAQPRYPPLVGTGARARAQYACQLAIPPPVRRDLHRRVRLIGGPGPWA